MKRFVFLLVLVWTYCAFGTTYYVATDGDNGNTGGIDDPWLTIQYAVNNAGDGDTVKIGAGTYNETAENILRLNTTNTLTFESQSGENDVNVVTSSTIAVLYVEAAGTYTFSNMTFRPTGASCSYLLLSADDKAFHLTFNNCTMDMDGKAGILLYTGGGATAKSIKYDGCTLIGDNINSYEGMFYCRDFNSIELTNCDITKDGGPYPVFWFLGTCGTLKLTNCNITCDNDATVVKLVGFTGSLDYLIVKNNTINDCYRFVFCGDDDIGPLEICDNTILSSGNGTTLTIGRDSGTGVNILSGFVIKNNTITMTSTAGHCILLGTNCYGAELSHNTFTSTDADDYGIVIKGNYNNVHHNICKSAKPLYLYDAQYNKVQYNTFYSIGSVCFFWRTAGGDTTPRNNIVTNNIFDASGGGTYAMSGTNAHHDNLIDYNCYKAGIYGAVRLDDTTYDDIDSLRSKWADWSDTWPENDAHSIIADPQFFDAASGDFGLKPGSPCLNTGRPTFSNGYTNIGAWQGISRSELLPANCIEWLEMDFNGDCKVDFNDFALFTQSWLECNLDPPEACWE